MRLNVWILEPDAAVAAELAAAWRSVAGDRVKLQIFSVLPYLRLSAEKVLKERVWLCVLI